MKSYIDKNTKLRKLAKSNFEKDFFKLMNNSVFGKTMENVGYRIDGHLLRDVQDADKYKKLTYKPNYKSTVPFEDCSLSFVEMYRTKTKLNKPIYCGVSILNISKTLMYDFYYNELKSTFGEKVNLLYTDTDSLFVQIERSSDDLTGYLNEKRNLFDFSNYPPNHPLYSVKNKKVIGKMKDKFGGKTILEAVCIRPKMYSILTTDHNLKKAKGVSKVVTEKSLTHGMYKSCLFDKTHYCNKQQLFRSDKHRVFTISQNKLSLSPLDTKRYILPNGIDTLAYGHKQTK